MGGAQTQTVLLGFCWVFSACVPPPAPIPDSAPFHPPALRPSSCTEVSTGTPLQKLLDAAPDSEKFCLREGEYVGPILLARGQTLWGPRAAVIVSTGQGTTVQVRGKGTQLLGLSVRGSGSRFDKQDAAIQIQGEDVLVDDVHVSGATFGILVEQSKRVTVSRNEIHGRTDLPFGLRGDGIRFWESYDSALKANFVRDARDLIARYSQRILIEDNLVVQSRYGMHLMYCREVTMRNNRSIGNVVGTFVMYSQDVAYKNNLVAAQKGAAGMGLGIKESGNITVEDNLFLRNTTSVYLDTSPIQLHHRNLFVRNAFRLSDAAVVFHSSPYRNRFASNSFHDNQVQVRVEGGGDALGTEWEGNGWDDYAGFDFDGDGVGDVPYELRSLSANLLDRFPDLQLLRGSPALSVLEALSHILPLFAPQAVLVDRRPLMRSLKVGFGHEH